VLFGPQQPEALPEGFVCQNILEKMNNERYGLKARNKRGNAN
jgi:hypothetical protein